MRSWILAFGLMCVSLVLQAQDAKLAQQYYNDGEYEKAVTLYEKLSASDNNNDYYFDRYVECLMELRRFEDAEKALVKAIKRKPKETRYYVTYGRLFEMQDKDDEAQKQYLRAIEQMPAERYAINKLATAFSTVSKYDLAIQTYEKGATSLNDPLVFAYNLADLYRRKGDAPKMIGQYLNSVQASPDRTDNVKGIFQRYLSNEDMANLRQQLLDRIQASPNGNNPNLVDMLAWVYIQEKDYTSALRQLRALDRQLKENGVRVYQLAEIAANDKSYNVAIEAYEYVVQKGNGSPFFLDSKQELLRCRRNKLVEGYAYTREDLMLLEKYYEEFINEFGKSRGTAPLVVELAELEALYINNLDKAIGLLDELIKIPGLPANTLGQAKLNLGDYYLMKNDVWESTLLYSQVDKAFKDDPMGHEARYRNARLSYFSGDFKWSQSQYDILKASTSRLISNDALDQSIFIMDNLNLDTTLEAMTYYAQADLLIFQNRFNEAFVKLDSLLQLYPNHSLEDDVWYLKAKVHLKKREYSQAAGFYAKIAENYPEEIRADNSIFALAELYETQLNDKEKAMKLYEKLFIDYSGSTFAVDARKKYRVLRGDKVQ